MKLTSTAFAPGEPIPAMFTCEGDDVSPSLAWSGAPPDTQTFALVMEDPDAPDPANPRAEPFVHWVLYGLPARVGSLPENVQPEDLPEETVFGLNDWKRTKYGGPCPPIGRHRYIFRLYALDFAPSGLIAPAKKDLLRAIEGHVLAEATLVGTYEKAARPSAGAPAEISGS